MNDVDRERAAAALPKLGRLAVCAACSQRLIAYYEAYWRWMGRQSPSVASIALDFVWAAAAGRIHDEGQVRALSQNVEALLAEGDQDEFNPQPFAFCGLLAVALSLRACAAQDEGVADCSACLEQGFDAADGFALNDILGPGPSLVLSCEDRVAAHPAMQSELAAQRADIEDAMMAGEPDWPTRLRAMRERAEACRFLGPITQ